MDDLIPVVIALLRGDAAFAGVTVRAPGGSLGAVYPLVTVSGAAGAALAQGDPGVAWREGTLRVEIFCRDDAGTPALDQMWALAHRAQFLLAGNRLTGDAGLGGRKLPSADGRETLTVSSVRVALPNGPVPDPDPKVSRYVCTLRAGLLSVQS